MQKKRFLANINEKLTDKGTDVATFQHMEQGDIFLTIKWAGNRIIELIGVGNG